MNCEGLFHADDGDANFTVKISQIFLSFILQ
jgi:hypothetical protein